MKCKYLFVVFLLSLLLYSAGHTSLYNIKDYGAKGIKDQKITQLLQKAVDDCHAAGGGVVYFPPGDYLAGAFVLKSNVTLHLEAGATLWASLDTMDYKTDYKVFKKDDSGKSGSGETPVFIYAKEANHIGITGQGRIHGQARREYRDLEKVDGFIAGITENARQSGVEMKMYYKVRPFTCLIFLESCEHVRIQNISLIESTDWTLHFKWCEKIFIDNIYVESSLEKGVNADGIDVDGCRDVVIANAIISTGDDCIVLKSTITNGVYQNCENVTVSNCVLTSTSTALKLGTESYGDFRHITFNNCTIRNTNRGLSIVVRDGATVDNVLFSNITMETNRKHFNWWGNGDPIWLVVKKRRDDSRVGMIKNVTFQNIIGHGEGTSKIEGFPGDGSSPARSIENIRLQNVQFHLYKESKPDKRCDDAFMTHHVNDLMLENVEVFWQNDVEPKWRNAFTFESIQGLRLINLSGKQAPTNRGCFIQTKAVKNAIIERCFVKPETTTFLTLDGKDNLNFYLNDNYLFHANQKIMFTHGAKNSVINKEN